MNSKVENQVVIQARMGSTRLPGKVLKELAGKPVLWHVVNRSQEAYSVDRVIVATTENREDNRIADWCKDNNILCVRGSSDDVLARYVKSAKLYPAKTIIRITADCPLVDPGTLDALVALHNETKSDYTTNLIKPTYPAGLDAELVLSEVLFKVDKIATLKSHREHVTLYIRENLDEFKTTNLSFGGNVEHIRLTLDREEDYQVLKAVFDYFPQQMLFPSIYEILSIIDAHPELIQINAKIDRYEGAKKSIKAEGRKFTL